MGGKTATAQKHPRDEKKWLVSVMSFAPAEDPSFILYVVIDEPEGTTGGEGDGMDSQELTHDIMEELLPCLGVRKTETEAVVTEEESWSSEDVYDDQVYDEDDRYYEEDHAGDTAEDVDYGEDTAEDVSYGEDTYNEEIYSEDDYRREEDGDEKGTEEDSG